MIVRPALIQDAAGVQAIYAHHVRSGDGTFEEAAPDVAEIARRMGEITGKGLPYVVAEQDGRVMAFAYAAPYRTRAAYRFTLEDSVYVAPDAPRQGFGRAVLQAVVDQCRDIGVHQLVAVIGGTGNAGSIALHTALGFQPAGVLRGVGYKFGRWLDVVNMQLPLNGGVDGAPLGAGVQLI
jgi:L-amino acid N-acyltransferase YncA